MGNLSNAWLIFMGNTSLQRSNVFVETVIYVMYYLENGNNKGVIKWEAVYKCTNRSKVKCIAHERSECRQGIYWYE